MRENTSGQGAQSMIPLEILGWSWGAFTMNWVWGLFNRTNIALLMFVPFVNLVMCVMLGRRGNEWAWRNKKWDSVGRRQAGPFKARCAIGAPFDAPRKADDGSWTGVGQLGAGQFV
jgi:hypothetical protein